MVSGFVGMRFAALAGLLFCRLPRAEYLPLFAGQPAIAFSAQQDLSLDGAANWGSSSWGRKWGIGRWV